MENNSINISQKTDFLKEPSSFKVKMKKDMRLIRNFTVFFSAIFLVLIALYSFILFRQNKTPDAVVKKALSIFFNKKNVSYNTDIRVNFSYASDTGDILLNNDEIYSLVRRSSSDSHSLNINGTHEWQDVPKGRFKIVWDLSDGNTFDIQGEYVKDILNYKIISDLGVGVENNENEGGYTSIKLNNLASKILEDEQKRRLDSISADDFNFRVVETLANDVLNNQDCRHYKIKPEAEEGYANELLGTFNPDYFDVWIVRKTNELKRIKGCLNIKNIGLEGNDLQACFDVSFSS